MQSKVNFRSAALVGLLFLMVLAPLTNAEPASNGMELNVEIDAPGNGLYHTDSSELGVTLKVKNHANQAQELVYNPACPFDLVLTSGQWQMDLDDTRVCPEQSRAMMIQPGQSRILSTWSWDWADAPSGEIELAFTQSDSGLQSTSEVVLHRIVEMPENLHLEAVLAETIGEQNGHNGDMPAMIFLTLSNSGVETIDLPFDQNCKIETDVLSDISCGYGSIGPGETMNLGWMQWNFENAVDGVQSIPFTLSGVNGAMTTIDTMYTQTPPKPSVDVTSHASLENGELLTWHFNLQNVNDAPAKLLFEDTCIVEAHVISPNGEIVYDTRGTQPCSHSGIEQKIAPQTTHTLASNSWDYMDADGCEIKDGLYLLVLNQPDHGLIATQSFEYINSGENLDCGVQIQDLSDIQFTVDNLLVLDADGENERVSFQVTIRNTGVEGFDLYWPTDCSLELQLAMIGQSTDRIWSEDCDGSAGHYTTIDSQVSYTWSTIEIPFVENGIELNHGTWIVSIHTTSLPTFTTQIAHTYDGVYFTEVIEESEDNPEEEIIPVDVPEVINDELILSGDWNYITTPNQGCWLLTDTFGDEYAFITHMQDGGWAPSPGLSGTYDVELMNAAGSCSKWSGIVILQTLDETETMPEVLAPVKPSSPPQTPVEQIAEIAPTAATVVATTSLSLMTLLYLGNTEWIRIPALQFGIGLIGMVRKNGEHDGEYQRGRIMGYLTANPGVHFRALLGALEMSNGQLTHHLKNLEGAERIWRRKDGRLVRFYPASIQSTLDDDELPVPLLTPDPNSLQGKILRLLDATENDIVNLSQKELAIRLEASQQLVSHHLRTLEKFGLIEREKVGMRYRYQLTREAIFLVNSNEYDVSTE